MSKLELFCIRDVKAGHYLPPMSLQNRGVAMRALSEVANNEQSMFFKHPTDYELYLIGTYDQQTSKIVWQDPDFIITVGDLITKRSSAEQGSIAA